MGNRPGLGLGGTAAGKEVPAKVAEGAAEGPGAPAEAGASGEEGPAAPGVVEEAEEWGRPDHPGRT